MRVEDALNATRAAVEEGIVAGGGTALLNAVHVLGNLNMSGDEAVGLNIVRRAVEEPVRQIATNCRTGRFYCSQQSEGTGFRRRLLTR